MTSTSLRLLYRATGGTNRKRRPEWFSKWVCLGSVLRALELVGDTQGQVHLTFLADGALPEDVTATMEKFGDVARLGGLGNSGSYLHTVDVGTDPARPGSEAVYLIEDDYLHMPEALAVLRAAVAKAPAGCYFTLYDHPDRYNRNDDLRPHGRPVEVLGGRHWRRVESTNMTYATTVATLRADRSVHRLSARFTSYPHDRALWRAVQGLGLRRPLRWARGTRSLLGPMPSLATHCEVGLLAPAVAWDGVAESTREWMRANGLDTEVGW